MTIEMINKLMSENGGDLDLELIENPNDLPEGLVVHGDVYGDDCTDLTTLPKNLTVKASAFSASAKEKIEKAGGKAEVI